MTCNTTACSKCALNFFNQKHFFSQPSAHKWRKIWTFSHRVFVSTKNHRFEHLFLLVSLLRCLLRNTFFVPYFCLQNMGVNLCWNVQSCAWDGKLNATKIRRTHLQAVVLTGIEAHSDFWDVSESCLTPGTVTFGHVSISLSLELEKRKNSKKQRY